jgi:hypothetical protein
MAAPTSARALEAVFFSGRAGAALAAADAVVSVVLLIGFAIKSKITIMIQGVPGQHPLNPNLFLDLNHFWLWRNGAD